MVLQDGVTLGSPKKSENDHALSKFEESLNDVLMISTNMSVASS